MADSVIRDSERIPTLSTTLFTWLVLSTRSEYNRWTLQHQTRLHRRPTAYGRRAGRLPLSTGGRPRMEPRRSFFVFLEGTRRQRTVRSALSMAGWLKSSGCFTLWGEWTDLDDWHLELKV